MRVLEMSYIVARLIGRILPTLCSVLDILLKSTLIAACDTVNRMPSKLLIEKAKTIVEIKSRAIKTRQCQCDCYLINLIN